MNLKEWMSSKKAKGFISGLVVLIATQLMGLPEDQAAELGKLIVYLTGAYMGSQGIADHGKVK